MKRALAYVVPAVAAALLLTSVQPSMGAVGPSLPAVPAGFSVTPYAALGDTPTSVAFGPDGRLYVTLLLSGRVVTVEPGLAGVRITNFATGFRNPLGVLVGSDGAVYVSDSEPPRPGPFGERTYGRVSRLFDTGGDGVADVREAVLTDLPNGRHNTNGMAFGPDGMLYITNGNATDDGLEGGQPEVEPWSGAVVRIHPSTTGMSLASLRPEDALVATGMRNLFDVAFSPVNPTEMFIPTNGVDDARPQAQEGPIGREDSDDLLYLTDIDDATRPNGRYVRESGPKAFKAVTDHFGFPSCLYNVSRQGNLEPYDNPNPDVIAAFGTCPADVPRPVASFGLHVSADGLAFQVTDLWGDEFRNDLFVAEFGNFFGPEGHRVVQVELDSSGRQVTAQRDFLSGVVPLDLTFDRSGDLYVADYAGVIYKVSRLG